MDKTSQIQMLPYKNLDVAAYGTKEHKGTH